MKRKKNESRGWRLNNPCCIRKGTKWQGLTQVQTDDEFCSFISPLYGFRAAVILICKTYYGRKKATIRQIISSWAPPTENDTEAYVRAVARHVGCSPDMLLPRPKAETKAVWVSLIWAIALHENGYVPNGLDSVIKKAFDMIFIEKLRN